MNKITLQAKTDPSITVTGELIREGNGLYDVRLAPDVSSNAFFKEDWERVYDLPTVPGTVIRATIRGVPNMPAFRVEAESDVGTNWWCSLQAIEGRYWHRDEHIDASTVVVEFTPSDKEGDA